MHGTFVKIHAVTAEKSYVSRRARLTLLNGYEAKPCHGLNDNRSSCDWLKPLVHDNSGATANVATVTNGRVDRSFRARAGKVL